MTGRMVQRINVDYMDGTSAEYITLTDYIEGCIHWQKFKLLDGSMMVLFHRNIKRLVYSPEWNEEEVK